LVVRNEVDGRNLLISFNYVQDSIEKVSYNVEGNKFNLIIQPKIGFPSLDTKTINYTYFGINSDLIFVIGAQQLKDLGHFYDSERDIYTKKPVINIDYHQKILSLAR